MARFGRARRADRAADPGPVVITTAGPVRGRVDGATRVWRGIRYAAPPVGVRRFAPPEPPEPWTDVLDAAAFGPACPQPKNRIIDLGPGITQDEDCLFLNVWSPVHGRERRPVMVWVHGGAYFLGAASQPVYDGASLATAGDVVIVTINYRVGVFGFADLGGLPGTGDAFDPNPGMRDVLLALQWVQDNIAAFGGDPAEVTLFGESAGGGIVTTLLGVPAAAGLFHQAIAQSSPVTAVYGRARAATVATAFVEELRGVLRDEAATGTSRTVPDGGPDLVELLRSLPAPVLLRAGIRLFERIPTQAPGTLAFAPVIDGDLLPRSPLTSALDGATLPVRLVIGGNRDETSAFARMQSPLIPTQEASIRAMFAAIREQNPGLTLPSEAQILTAYADAPRGTVGLGVSRDIGFRMPTLWFAQAHSRVAPVWLYRFDFSTRVFNLLKLGATHATELPYVFGTVTHRLKDITYKLGGYRAGKRLSRRMQARWLAFANHGAPDDPYTPQWPSYDEKTRATLVFDRSDRRADDLDGPLRRAWGDQALAFD